MKLQVKTKDFCDAVQMISTVVPVRSTKPILSNVRINASKDKVELLATDLEVGMRCVVDGVTVQDTGSAVVPANELLSILRETPDEMIHMAMEDTTCQLKGQDSSYSLPGADPADFPDVPEFGDKGCIELKADLLHEMIRKTSFATAKEKTRYALNGVLLVIRPETIEMVATDGRRLAYMRKRSKSGKDTQHEVIVPKKAVDEVERVLSDEEKTVKVSVLESQILFSMKRAMICSRLVDGHFPDFKSVVPTDNDKKVELKAGAFLSAVRRAALVTSEESKAVRVHLEKGKITIVGRSPERGEAKIQLEVEYDDEPLEVAFNPDFLIDMLKILSQDVVKVELKNGDRPGLLRVGTDYQYVVMPVTSGQSA
ncbi:DNA polymerase III subunit beta [Candidatus Bipolaricaulota bacterium]|nr:DNA polymerase III subunit beta [Candidatus Bipolaricaulota bacterium]